jgi:hypothetical protein
MIKGMFDQKDILIDFNNENFDPFRKDASNFMDGAHLSYKGESFLLKHLNETLKTITSNKALD